MIRRYGEVVVGGTLEALTYAFNHDLPVLYTRAKAPFEFDYCALDSEIDNFCMPPPVELLSPSGPLQCGPSKLQVWQKLLFILSLSGKIIYGDNINSIIIRDDIMRLNIKASRSKEIKFVKAIVFDDEMVTGLPNIYQQVKNKNIVYDWVNMNSGGSHHLDYIEYKDDFISKVYFYPSRRHENKRIKDLVCVSRLTDEQVSDFSFSDTYLKFKMLDLLKELGIRGARNGKDATRPGHYKYYAVKIEPTYREVVSQVENRYEDDGRFLFNYQDFNDIIRESSPSTGYLKRVADLI